MHIPGYTILREIGRGGTAVVYLAEQDSLGRPVALKVMSAALAADPSFSERFVREGRTIAQLRHPNIVSLYDIGVADERPYIAMEHVEGDNLKERIRSGVSPKAAVDILRQVATALAFAHSKGFVHRDVKPANILFREDGSVVLTDFGISRTIDSNTRLTETGTTVGTPHYMSPEQARGRATDARTDLYALGVILYEMLTGRPPYDARDAIAIAYSHVNDSIPRLPARLSLLQPMLGRLLAKDPDDRFASADDLIAAVDRLRRTVRRHREGRVAGGVGSVRATLFDVIGEAPRWVYGAVGVAVAALAVGMVYALNPPGAGAPERRSEPTAGVAAPDAVAAVGDSQDQAATRADVTIAAVATDAPDPSVTVLAPAHDGAVSALAPRAPPETAPDAFTSGPTAGPAAGALTESAVSALVYAPEVEEPAADSPAALLAEAETHLEAFRLTKPAGRNAYDIYRVVLERDPDSARAEQGIERIAERYVQLARLSRSRGEIYKAKRYIASGLTVAAGHPALRELEAEIAAQQIRDTAPPPGGDEAYARGERLYYGLEGETRNYAAALDAYRQAAESGHVDAMYSIGVMYARGQGVNRNLNTAVRWFRIAAEHEHVAAQYHLGLAYAGGRGAEEDPDEAFGWFMRAAGHEDVDAYKKLGWMYQTGLGVEKDWRKSLDWYSKASKEDIATGVRQLKVLFGKVDEEETAPYPEKRVEDWEFGDQSQ